jgi:hypothetical protein
MDKIRETFSGGLQVGVSLSHFDHRLGHILVGFLSAPKPKLPRLRLEQNLKPTNAGSSRYLANQGEAPTQGAAWRQEEQPLVGYLLGRFVRVEGRGSRVDGQRLSRVIPSA